MYYDKHGVIIHLSKCERQTLNIQPIKCRCILCGQWPRDQGIKEASRIYGCCTVSTCTCPQCVVNNELSSIHWDWQGEVESVLQAKRLIKKFKQEIKR